MSSYTLIPCRYRDLPHAPLMTTTSTLPEMRILTFSCPDILSFSARRAAQQWNDALSGLCSLVHVGFGDIQISFGPVNRADDSSRVAQCNKYESANLKRWRITLADDRVWKTWSNWKFWKRYDEDAVAALLHEFGHALGFNHSDVYSSVMHPRIGTTIISMEEKELFRERYQMLT